MSDIDAARKLLERAGFQVKTRTKYKLHSFEVQADILKKFLHIVRTRKLKHKECISQALSDWINKHI